MSEIFEEDKVTNRSCRTFFSKLVWTLTKNSTFLSANLVLVQRAEGWWLERQMFKAAAASSAVIFHNIKYA